eukprot:snap_masked-scaffold_21-processed-gene-2.8-mRNA-1 protein AED:0.22 eAED:0.22 QI:0/-1/0/1/-1/1/1/0/342
MKKVFARSIFTATEQKILDPLRNTSLLRIDDFNSEQFRAVLSLSNTLETVFKSSVDQPKPLVNKSIAAIFQKRSTRTRVSTETGMNLLGGQTLFLSSEDIQLGVNETVFDTAQVLSRFNSIILARVHEHKLVHTLATSATVPVINALCDVHHPLQALADIKTLEKEFPEFKNKKNETIKVCYIGDGNNVAHDLLLSCSLLGINSSIVTPKGYEIKPEIADDVRRLAEKSGAEFIETVDFAPGLENADVVVTDTWISMGQEDEAKKRLKDFKGFMVTEELMQKNGVNEDWRFLHCLPRHKEEVDDKVFYSERSLVFDEAENRMWTVMSVILTLLGKTDALIGK